MIVTQTLIPRIIITAINLIPDYRFETRSMAIEDPIIPTATTEPETVAADASVPKKVKKAPAKAKPRSPSLHPPYFEMIKEAIVALKERTGSSQYAIAKYVEENQKNLPANFKKVLSTQLKKIVAAGKLAKVKASYKLPAARAPAKKKPVAKPKTAAKPKTVKKIAPAKKKKTVAIPNPAPKVKAAAKPKVAAKTKAVAKPAVKAKAAAKPKAKTPVKAAKVAVKKAAVKKPAAVKSLKPKAAIAKKASGIKKAKK